MARRDRLPARRRRDGARRATTAHLNTSAQLSTSPSVHPLARIVLDGAAGRFPVPDGLFHRVPPWRGGVEAVLAFTGHAVLAVDRDVTDGWLTGLGVDGVGGAHHPGVLAALAGPRGWIDSLDVLLVARGTGRTGLVARPDLADHPRVGFAAALRDDVQVFGRRERTSRSVATVSRGIGGLPELSVELDPRERGRGSAAELVAAAAGTVPRGDVVVAAVAPGNAASLRAFLRAGFTPLASVQLLRPAR